MIRDRLAELQAAQDEEDKDVCVAVEVTAEQASMDHFFVQIQEVLEETCKLEEAVSQVRKKHSEILSSSQSDPNLTRELDDLTAAIKRSGTRVNTKLKEIAPRLVEENEKHSADVRIRRTQHGGATRRFGEAMTLYYNVQEEYRDRCKDKIHRQMKITGKDPTEEELNEMLEKDNLEIFTQEIMMETQQAKQQLQDIENRHQEIVKLENSLRELHDLFIDISVMIHSQGEMVDNIASHVSNSQNYVEAAKEQTVEALKYQGKVRKKKILCGVILLVVLVILVIIIAVSV